MVVVRRIGIEDKDGGRKIEMGRHLVVVWWMLIGAETEFGTIPGDPCV